MTLSNAVGKVGKTVLTGVAGAAAYDVVKRTMSRLRGHDLAVTSMAWGLRGVRNAEKGAEAARLRTADIVAEAKGRIGEQTSPPVAGSAPHEH